MASAELAILVRAQGASQAAAQISQVGGSLNNLQRRAGSFASTLRTNVGGALNTFGGRIRSLVTGPLGMLGLAGGIGGVGLAIQKTVSSAMDFQQAMELIRTQTGKSQAEVDSMSKAVLELAKTLPQGANELAAGLYHIESAGYSGAKALEILKVAAQGAATGGADLESVTNALVGAEQSGVKGAESAAVAMGALNAIVGAGNMRMQDLTDAFGSGILASARTFGVSLTSIGAALATMTDEGIPAIDAATRLRMSLSLLGAPTGKAITQLQKIGISQYELAKDMRSPGGFVTAIGDLRDHMVKAGLIGKDGNPNAKGAALLSRAFGGGRSSAAIMTLLSNFTLLEQKQKAVTAGANGFGDAVKSASETAAYKFGQFQSRVGVLAIQIGNVLLPLLIDAMGGISDWIDQHGDDVVSLARNAGDAIRVAVGAIGTVVSAIGAAWSMIPKPLRDLIAGGVLADRTLKFLFGFSPIKMVVSGIETALGKAVGTGLGQAGLGKLFVQHVWVDNMGAGMGGGGGGPSAAPGVLATLGVTGIASLIVVAAAVAGGVWALYGDKVSNPDGSRVIPGTGAGTGFRPGGRGERGNQPTGSAYAAPATSGTGGLSPDDRQDLNNLFKTSLKISDRTEGVRIAIASAAGKTAEAADLAARKTVHANEVTASRTEALRMTLAAKNFSPRITIPVHTTVYAQVSARETSQTRTTYAVYNAGGGGKFES